MALNKLQWLICHKTEPNQTLYHKQDLTQGLTFKESWTGLNLTFLLLNWLPCWNIPSFLLFTDGWKKKSWVHTLSEGWKLPTAFPGFEIRSLCSFPWILTIIPQVPPIFVYMRVHWKVHVMISYLLLITFLTNGIQTLQQWKKCVDCEWGYVEN